MMMVRMMMIMNDHLLSDWERWSPPTSVSHCIGLVIPEDCCRYHFVAFVVNIQIRIVHSRYRYAYLLWTPYLTVPLFVTEITMIQIIIMIKIMGIIMTTIMIILHERGWKLHL